MAIEKTCPVCNSSDLFKFLERQDVPVHQNLLMSSKKDAVEIQKGILELFVCTECGFVFNGQFDFSKLKYGKNYDNTQDISPYFNSYISTLASNIIETNNTRNSSIVEIGCGKGTFLKKLVHNKNWGNVGFGFDPSYVGKKTRLSGRLNFEQRYYDSDCVNIKADVIVCRHVIEHLPDPLSLLKLIRKTLGNSTQVKLYFETPTVDWILKKHVPYDFFYEHCSYFNLDSLTTAFQRAGFKVIKIDPVFSGQYMWLEAVPTVTKTKFKKNSGKTAALAKQFSLNEKRQISKWKRQILNLSQNGCLAIWGAGAKGVTFCNLFDPHCKFFKFVIDINPNKHGKFIPGSGHKIISYKEILKHKITTVILMNSNYYDETLDLLKELNVKIDLISS